MSAIRIYDGQLTISDADGNVYEFLHFDSVGVDTTARTRITRGANAGDRLGVSYKEGLKEADTMTIVAVDVPADLHTQLKTWYDAATRLKIECVDSIGSSVVAFDSVISREPHQLSIDESVESMNLELIFESFNITTTYK